MPCLSRFNASLYITSRLIGQKIAPPNAMMYIKTYNKGFKDKIKNDEDKLSIKKFLVFIISYPISIGKIAMLVG